VREVIGVRTILMCSKTLARRRHESGGRRVDHRFSRRVFRRYLVEIAMGLPAVLTYAFLGFRRYFTASLQIFTESPFIITVLWIFIEVCTSCVSNCPAIINPYPANVENMVSSL